MKEKYQMTYNDQYTLNSPHNRDLMNLFFKKCQEYQMMCNYLEIFEYLQEFEDKNTNKKERYSMTLNNFLYSKKMENHLFILRFFDKLHLNQHLDYDH